MSADINRDGVDDGNTIFFHVRSGVIGALLALLIGGGALKIAVEAFPDWQIVRSVADTFAGGVCDSYKIELSKCELKRVCHETLMQILGEEDICKADQ